MPQLEYLLLAKALRFSLEFGESLSQAESGNQMTILFPTAVASLTESRSWYSRLIRFSTDFPSARRCSMGGVTFSCAKRTNSLRTFTGIDDHGIVPVYQSGAFGLVASASACRFSEHADSKSSRPTLVIACRAFMAVSTGGQLGMTRVGFEPTTYGLKVRCSTN